MSWTMKMATALLAAVALVSVDASAAEAVTWHNFGDTAFTATGGPVSLTVGATTLACSGSSMAGTMSSAPFVGSTWAAASGTLTGTPCTLAGQNFHLGCAYTYTAVAVVAPVVIGVADLTCDFKLASSGTVLCHISGGTPVSYTNPSSPTKGRFTFLASSSLTIRNVANCPWGPGGSLGLGEFTQNITAGTGGGGLGPMFVRTA